MSARLWQIVQQTLSLHSHKIARLRKVEAPAGAGKRQHTKIARLQIRGRGQGKTEES